MTPRLIAAAIAIALLAGCASSGSSTGVLPGGGANSPASQADSAAAKGHRHRVTGYARFVIPRKKRHRRRSKFVSGATLGASIVASASGGGTVTTIANLSPSSNFCTGTGTTRSCTVPVSVPIGDDTITITLYDQAPVGGAIPPSAQVLGTGSATQTVSNGGVAPSITVFISGQIGSIGLTPAFASVPADGTTSTAVFAIDPRDFGNQPIKAGTKDPYANPIAATLTAGSGHATLLLNGLPITGTATLKYSTDALSLRYDGLGAPGYSITVSLSAAGVTTQTAEVSPLFVRGAAIRNRVLGLNGSGVPAANLTITEADYTGTFASGSTGCSTIANPSAISGTGPSTTFTVRGGVTASASGCTVSVTDNNPSPTTFNLPTTNTPITSGVPINGVEIDQVNVGVPSTAIAVGPDRFMYFVVPNSSMGILDISTSSPTLFTQFLVPTAAGSPPPSMLRGITTGPDGAVWATDATNGGADRITMRGMTPTVSNYPQSSFGQPFGIASSSDGTMYVGGGAPSGLMNLTVGGGFTQPTTTSNAVHRVVQGSDGAMWFAEGTSIGRWDPSTQTLTEQTVPFGSSADDICATSSEVWFAASGGTQPLIGEIASPGASFTITPHALTTPTTALGGVACGIDNAVWYLDVANNQVGRFSIPSGVETTYNNPTSGATLQFITVAPDGSLFFTETAAGGMMGHILP